MLNLDCFETEVPPRSRSELRIYPKAPLRLQTAH
jgi:hypothetical protein